MPRVFGIHGLWLFVVLLMSCSEVRQPLVKTEIFFGLHDSVENRNITETEWRKFVDTEIVSRLSKGFTIIEGCKGTWYSQKTGIQSEGCRILLFVHPKSKEMNERFLEIIQAYKNTFHQESVLHLSSLIYKAMF